MKSNWTLILFLSLHYAAAQRNGEDVDQVKGNQNEAHKSRGISTGPFNVACIVGGTVTLICESDLPMGESRVQWYEYAYSPSGGIISENNVILNITNGARYRIIHDRDTQFDLEISDLLITDGGTYRCRDSNDGPPNFYYRQADLIVLESHPQCSTVLPDDGVVLVDQYYSIECHITYQGQVAPVIHWNGPEPYTLTDTTSPTTVLSIVSFNTTRAMDQWVFQGITNFTERTQLPPEYASNAPSYFYLYQTQRLSVNWIPSNISAEPTKPAYQVGDVVTCSADGQPAPIYQWTNMLTLLPLERGPTFVVSEGMSGLNQTLRCRAMNTIGAQAYYADIFIVVYVPILTSPTVTTTTPGPTTPVPDNAPCDDLTGRWRSTNPNAEMCIEVNTRGEVIGIIRNGTDPYFVAFTGLTVYGDYKHIGFGGNWPSDLGIGGFVGECHKCFGVESLLISGVWRAAKDSPECGVSAGINLARLYIFTRFGNPCRTNTQEKFRVLPPSHVSQQLGITLQTD